MNNAASLVRSLPIVASALGRKLGVRVVIRRDANTASTDGDLVTLPELPETEESLVLARGYIDHESAHIRETNFNVPMGKGVRKKLFNILEDVRIEPLLWADYPGVRMNLNALIDLLVSSGKGFKPVPADAHPLSILMARVLYCLRYEVLGNAALKDRATDARKVFEQAFPASTVASIDQILSRVPSLGSTQDAAAMADELLAVINEETKPQPQQNCDSTPQPEESDADNEGSEESSKVSTAGDGPLDESKQGKEDGTSDETETEGDTAQGGSADDESTDDAGAKNAGGVSDDDSDAKSEASGDSGNSDADSDASGDSEGSGKSSGSDATGDSSSQSGKEQDGSAEGQQDGEQDANSSSTSGGSSGSKDRGNAKPPKGTAKPESGDEAEPDHSKKEANRKAAAESLEDEDAGGQHGDLGDVISDVLKDLNYEGRLKRTASGTFPMVAPTKRGTAINASETAKETTALRVRLNGLIQASKLKRTAPRRVGTSIDTRSLYKLRTLDTRVFQGQEHKQAVNTAIAVLIDQSYSMNGMKAMATKAGLAVAQALSTTPGVQLTVAGFSSMNDGTGIHTPVVRPMKLINQRMAQEGFVPAAEGGTPIADALWWASSELLSARNATRRIVITITDGKPDDANRVREIVERMKGASIENRAIGIGVSIDRSLFASSCTINSVSELPARVFAMLQGDLAG